MKNTSPLAPSWFSRQWVKSVLRTVRSASLLSLPVLGAVHLAQAQTPLLQLKAANYNPNTGLWTASVGANAQATGTYPTLATGVSPNGAPAVVFNGANQLSLATTIPAANGYTAFAYIKPGSGGGSYALFGGSSGAFEYRVNATKQDALKQQTTDLGSETTTLSTSAFSLIDVTVTNVTGGGFRLNGVADGSTAASSFSQPIASIGARSTTGNENFNGSICEIDIYGGVLTPTQITNIEATLTAAYVTAVTNAPTLLLDTAASPAVGPLYGNDTLSAYFSGTLPINYQWQVATNSSGGGVANIAGATNNTLTLTNLLLANSGLYYRLQATNTVSPYIVNSSWYQLLIQPVTPLVQLQATNYNASTGVWLDSSGNTNNATYSGSGNPVLATFVTPNGGSAVNITNVGGHFLLNSSLSQSSGYTVFVYAMPSVDADGARHSFTGGSSAGALEYDLYSGKQDYLTEYTTDVGSGTTTVATNAFSLMDLAVNSSGATFRINGAVDATVSGATFTSPITRIGNNEGSGDGYKGDIAEIDIYNGVLNNTQITNIEAQLTARFVTANSISIGAATVSPTNDVFAGNAVTLSAPVVGATGTTTYHWQTDNGTGGATFSNISGATTTNYVLSTGSLLGTYEYQLVGTPFGGTSITSAPVTLIVQAASAPVVVTDTTLTPNTTSAMVGGSVAFSAGFTGNTPITYQWQVSANSSGSGAVNIAGATNASYTLYNLQLTNSGYYYSLRATNSVSPYVANSTWTELVVNPLSASVQLVATNYTSGVWYDASGNGNNAIYSGGTTPTLATFVTPNGSSAVNISTNTGHFLLNSPLSPTIGYTVVAYIEPSSTTGRNALTGGSSAGALEYDIYNGKQDYLTEYTHDYGVGQATVPTTNFSLVDLTVNASGAAFRYNGTVDTNIAGATFTSNLTRIGNNEGNGDGFAGNIAEIDIFTGTLTSNQLAAVEAQFTSNYVTAGTIAIGAATVTPTNVVFAGNPATLAAPVVGGTGTTSYQWQTDNGTYGATFSNISGATGTNYALSTASLLGTYEYQLIGTPLGGISVTSAPVTLTVQSASAPVVVNDTSYTPDPAVVDGSVTYSASFTGNTPITYQWQVSANSSGSGAVNIPGATNATLVLNNLQLTNANYYSLQASNSVSPNLANSSWVQITVNPLSALVQLQATNYNAGSGVWTDSSGNGNNATYTGAPLPSLVSAVTPGGGSAVNITNGGGYFLLNSPLSQSSGYTVFAYMQPSVSGGRQALTGGTGYGALEYDINGGNQDYLIEWTSDVGHGTSTISTSGFSLVDLAVNSSGASFRVNGSADGTVSGASFTAPITAIGNNEGSGDGFVGEISEVDIYSGVLNSNQISLVEAQLTGEYVTSTVATYPTNITASVSGNVLHLAWPSDHTGWRLLVQTNNLANGISSNTNDWGTVAGSASVNSTNLTINPSLPAEFYRLVYP